MVPDRLPKRQPGTTEPDQEVRAVDLTPFRITDGRGLRLGDHPTKPPDGWDRDKAESRTRELNEQLLERQALLYADGRHKFLVVLQALDAGGKDGTIRNVFRGVNPSGVRVASFKKPSTEELSHDYLWRIHQRAPADGEMVIFNRSHYEDVLVVRVLDLVPEERWRRRYEHLVNFERMLTDEGTTIVKLFLHITKDEQRKRLQKRLDDPTKNWKFEMVDLENRARWDDYQSAFEEAIAHTATDFAPWYIVPANKKWFRNLVISEILVQTLDGLDLAFPAPMPGLDKVHIE
jgi:PPK2 family polyphosphate:nucleotide phosphotransferase